LPLPPLRHVTISVALRYRPDAYRRLQHGLALHQTAASLIVNGHQNSHHVVIGFQQWIVNQSVARSNNGDVFGFFRWSAGSPRLAFPTKLMEHNSPQASECRQSPAISLPGKSCAWNKITRRGGPRSRQGPPFSIIFDGCQAASRHKKRVMPAKRGCPVRRPGRRGRPIISRGGQ